MTKEEAEEFETDMTDEIVCPHCGYEMSDSWEYDDSLQREREGEFHIECGNCDEVFGASIHIDVSYSSHKLDTCEDCGVKCVASTFVDNGTKVLLCSECSYKRRFPKEFEAKEAANCIQK